MMCSPRARLRLVRRSAAALSVTTAPVVGEPFGSIDMPSEGAMDMPSLAGATLGVTVVGAFVAPVPPQAAKTTTAAAVRAMGRNFTS